VFPVPLNRLSELSEESESLFHEFQEKLEEGKHFQKEGDEVAIFKKGLFRLSALSGNEELLDSLEILEEQEAKIGKIERIFQNLETYLYNFSETLLENPENQDLEKIERFVNTFEKFLKSREILEHNNRGQGFGQIVSDFASGTRDIAYKFATKTEDDAYKFASNMGKDAYRFTSDTRDKAHDFVMKTEDDAYKFASNMGKDAYQFASKGMDYGYQFASKGMEYGYQFASKGEEVGEMANRVLWMASEIGIMADRIGEMADRIVHTEHLIVQTAMLIQNFGLLIDGTIKHMSESILKSISLLLGQEFEPLKTTDKHLEIISEITKEILKNNHEYDMAVLEKQMELRRTTISALDKIEKNF
jgi:Mg2+ and Co2+ transporter CorA